MHVNRGFTVEQTITATIDLPKQQYPDLAHRVAFYRETLSRLRGVPGIEDAAVTSVLPLTGDSWGDIAQASGDTRTRMQLPLESFRSVSPDYFKTIQLPLIAGSFFSNSEWGKNVAVISDETATKLWPGKDPIGRQFRRAADPSEEPFTVLGVVGNARTISLATPDPMLIYVPYWYRTDETAGLVIRTHDNSGSAADSLLHTIWGVDHNVAVPSIRPLSNILADSLANQRFEMDLLMLFAASALLLAGLGVGKRVIFPSGAWANGVRCFG